MLPGNWRCSRANTSHEHCGRRASPTQRATCTLIPLLLVPSLPVSGAGVGGNDDGDTVCSNDDRNFYEFNYTFAYQPNTYCELQVHKQTCCTSVTGVDCAVPSMRHTISAQPAVDAAQ